MERIFIDLDGVLADWWKKAEGITGIPQPPDHDPKQDEIIAQMEKDPHFYRDLDPIPGSVEAVNALNQKYDIYILSTAPWTSPSAWMDKRLWVEEILGDVATKKLILSNHKNLFTGRALIDDRTKNGAAEFNGEHIHFGKQKFPDWQAVLRYLI